MGSKTCTKCGETKLLTEYYFRNKKKPTPRATCKDCYRAYQKAWKEANPEKVKAQSKAYYQANPEKVKAQSKAWREANPEKVKAQDKAYYQANSEKIKARKKAYYQANTEKEKAYRKAYYQANTEKEKAYQKAWKEANPEKAKYWSHKSHAKQRGIKHEISFDQFTEALKEPCHYCGNNEVTGLDRKDSSGYYAMDNCVPCCHSCNSKKRVMEYNLFKEKINLDKDLLKQ